MNVAEFTSEAEMQAVCHDWLRCRYDVVGREFPLPWGICDLVAADFDRERLRGRWADGQRAPLGNRIRARVLISAARSKGLRLTDTHPGSSRQSPVGLNAFDRSPDIDYLQRRGLLTTTATTAKSTLPFWAPCDRRIVAIELKLTRLAEVIRQAKRHRAFAHTVYIGMPLARAEAIACSDAVLPLLNDGLGLLGVSQDSCIELAQPLNEFPSDAASRLHASESLYRRLLEAHKR